MLDSTYPCGMNVELLGNVHCNLCHWIYKLVVIIAGLVDRKIGYYTVAITGLVDRCTGHY